MPTLSIIVASTRPGRVGLPVAEWVRDHAVKHGGFDVRLLDLAEVALPLFDEPNHPATGRYEHEHTKAWSAQIAASDAFVFVMPEYNHSYNAALKNALDYLHREWADKPVAFVSYGGVSSGLRAVTAIKPVVAALRMVPIVEGVPLPMVFSQIADGVFTPTEINANSATAMLDELARYTATLAAHRAAKG